MLKRRSTSPSGRRGGPSDLCTRNHKTGARTDAYWRIDGGALRVCFGMYGMLSGFTVQIRLILE